MLDEKNPHLRNTRDGTMIKLDANKRACTMDMWTCLVETGSVFSWQGTVGGLAAFDTLVRPAALCRGEKAEHRKLEEVVGTELNGVSGSRSW